MRRMRRVSRVMLDRAMSVKEEVERQLRGHPDVVGIGVGFRERRGHLIQRCCVRVHIRKKFALESIPRDLLIPASYGGFPVDVIESNYREHVIRNPASRFDPLLGGIVMANARRFERDHKIGTGGCIFRNNDGETLFLSNWHVLYGAEGNDGDRVVQPRPFGDFNDIGLTRKGVISQQVDCAVALLNSAREVSLRILDAEEVVREPAETHIGLPVRKQGANGTGIGVVAEVGLSLLVRIDGVTRSFTDQIEIRPRLLDQSVADLNTSDGDSGSLWISDDDHRIVGLHFAGDTGRALANPITSVVEALRAEGVDLGM